MYVLKDIITLTTRKTIISNNSSVYLNINSLPSFRLLCRDSVLLSLSSQSENRKTNDGVHDDK